MLDLIKCANSNFEGPTLLTDDPAKQKFAEELVSYSDSFVKKNYASFKGDSGEAAGQSLQHRLSSMDGERSPVRATYVNLYKWPESDAEFVKSAAVHGGARLDSRVVDSISCRQTYLKSYTFSREETLLEKTMKCLGKVRKMVAAERNLRWRVTVREMMVVKRKLRWRVVTMEVKDFSAAAFRDILRRLRSCSTPVDMEKLGY